MLIFVSLLAVLGFLWFVDEITTKMDVQKYGLKSEENPLMKFFIKKGFKYVTEFKLISFIIFLFISYLIYSMQPLFFYIFALFIIMIYLGVNIRNLRIFKSR